MASFDTEALIDQRARRPIARLEDGVTTELTWPAIRLLAGKDRVGRTCSTSTGPEPDFRWPTFIEAVVGLVRDLGVRIVVGLGAFPAPTPHTRPVRLASTVPPQSADLAGRVGFVHGTLEVPAGVQAALEVALGNAGVPVIGLWARVPHYVSAMPYPEASAALIEGLAAVSRAVARLVLAAHGRGGVPPPGGRAHRREPRAPRHGPAGWSGHRLGGGRPARARRRRAQRRRDRRRARAVPQRRRALTARVAAGDGGSARVVVVDQRGRQRCDRATSDTIITATTITRRSHGLDWLRDVVGTACAAESSGAARRAGEADRAGRCRAAGGEGGQLGHDAAFISSMLVASARSRSRAS